MFHNSVSTPECRGNFTRAQAQPSNVPAALMRDVGAANSSILAHGRVSRKLQLLLAPEFKLLKQVWSLLSELDAPPAFWADLVGVHGWAARSLARDPIEDTVVSVLYWSTEALSFGLRLSPQSHRIARALLRSDLLQAYAQLCSVLVPRGIGGQDFLAHLDGLTTVIKSFTNLGISARLHEDDSRWREVVRELIAALSSSQLLEHAAAATLRAQEVLWHTHQRMAGRAGGGPPMGSAAEAEVACLAHLYNFSVFLSAVAELLKIARLRRCPRPLYESTARDDPASLALLAETRALLSRPCLQYWLGRQVVAAGLLLRSGEGPRYGLPDPHLPLPPLEASIYPAARLVLSAASAVWGITVSGRVVQPLAGCLPAVPTTAASEAVEVAGAGAAGAAAAEAAALHAPNRGVPYSAVNVYDMTHMAMTAALAGADAAEYQSPAQLMTYPSLPDLALLLVRLVLELPLRHTALRLPGLWKTLSRVLPGLQPMVVNGSHPTPCLLHLTGMLLRLEVEEAAVEMRKDESAAEAVAGVTAGGVPGVQAGGSAGAVVPAASSNDPVEQAGGQGGTTDARAAETAAAACPFSLRCALDGGFLPAVEQLLRGLLVTPASAGAGPQPGSVEMYLLAVNVLLRYSGVWPAVLAHGSVRQAASLVLTLRKAVRALAEGDKKVHFVAFAGAVDRCLVPQPGQHLLAASVHHWYLSALLEQTIQLIPALLPLQPASTAAAAASGGSGDSRLFLATQLRLPPSSRTASRGPLAFNDSLESLSTPMDLQWLVRAGGRPPPSSPAAQQQRELAVFALTHWLPDLLSVRLSGPASLVASCRLLLLPALQCLIAWQHYVQAAQQAGSGSSSRGCSRSGDGSSSGGSGSGGSSGSSSGGSGGSGSSGSCRGLIEGMESWLSFLLEDLEVEHWLRKALYMGSYGEGAPGAAAKGAGLQELGQERQQQEAAAQKRLEAEAAALNLLEVMAVTLSAGDLLQLLQPVVTQRGAPEEGGGTSSAPHVLPRLLCRLEGMLVRHRRHRLLAALAELSHSPAAAADGVGGDPGSSGSGGRGGEGPALAALRSEVAAKHDLPRLPVLPSPAAAARALAAAGVVLCGNPECTNLEGPSEAELMLPSTPNAAPGSRQQPHPDYPDRSSRIKTCSRCRAVHYCSGACCWQHWQEGGHKEECAGVQVVGCGGDSRGGDGGVQH